MKSKWILFLWISICSSQSFCDFCKKAPNGGTNVEVSAKVSPFKKDYLIQKLNLTLSESRDVFYLDEPQLESVNEDAKTPAFKYYDQGMIFRIRIENPLSTDPKFNTTVKYRSNEKGLTSSLFIKILEGFRFEWDSVVGKDLSFSQGPMYSHSLSAEKDYGSAVKILTRQHRGSSLWDLIDLNQRALLEELSGIKIEEEPESLKVIGPIHVEVSKTNVGGMDLVIEFWDFKSVKDSLIEISARYDVGQSDICHGRFLKVLKEIGLPIETGISKTQYALQHANIIRALYHSR